MATGFRVLGYADLSEAFSFIRDCEAEGNEGVSPETYGTRTAAGIIRPQLPIQHRDRGYLTEDDLIAAIDAGISAEQFGAEELANDEADGLDEIDADAADELDEAEATDDDVDYGVSDDGAHTATEAGSPALIQDLPIRIGSCRELTRLGVELYERRCGQRGHNSVSWKDNVRRRSQFLRHARRS